MCGCVSVCVARWYSALPSRYCSAGFGPEPLDVWLLFFTSLILLCRPTTSTRLCLSLSFPSHPLIPLRLSFCSLPNAVSVVSFLDVAALPLFVVISLHLLTASSLTFLSLPPPLSVLPLFLCPVSLFQQFT